MLFQTCQNLSTTSEILLVIGMQIFDITLAIVLPSIGTAFNIASATGVTWLFFVLPSMFMIMTLNKFPKGQRLAKTTEGIILNISAYLVFVIGLSVCGATLYATVT